MKNRRLAILGLVAVVLGVAVVFLFSRDTRVPVYTVEVVATHPHDPGAFTEGLFFQDGAFYESTGEEGSSGIRKVDPETGDILQSAILPPPYFGEGIVAWKDRLIELTWKDQKGFVYGLSDFSLRDSFDYQGEGWGMTHDDKYLIMSDGSATLRFLDPDTLKQVSTLNVTANGCAVPKLNELEWIDGEIFANIWQTSLVAVIDPASGKVKRFLDLGSLGASRGDPDAVANGIAWDAGGKRLFVTGKHWPQLYQIRATEKRAEPEAANPAMQCGKQSSN